jgi:hypothetical protein
MISGEIGVSSAQNEVRALDGEMADATPVLALDRVAT